MKDRVIVAIISVAIIVSFSLIYGSIEYGEWEQQEYERVRRLISVLEKSNISIMEASRINIGGKTIIEVRDFSQLVNLAKKTGTVYIIGFREHWMLDSKYYFAVVEKEHIYRFHISTNAKYW